MAEKDPKIKTEEWQTQLDAINDAVLIVDHDQIVLRANRTAEKFFNLPAMEMVGKHCREILACEKNPPCECPFLRAKESSFREDSEFFCNDNWFQVTVDPVLDSASRFTGAVLIFKDITIRRQTENALREREERYREIVEDTVDLIITVDHNGLIVFSNYMANRIFGLPQSDIIGMHISKCIHPDDKDNTRRYIDEAVAKHATKGTFENRQVSHQTGEIRHLLWTSNFHYDSDGNLTGVTSIARDITIIRKFEEELKKAHDDLERRVKERTKELEKANKELHEKTNSLEELNTALKIILDRREKDKEENGEKILLNVKELLLPYINKLKMGPLNENQKNYVGLLESGLLDIISPFAQKLTSRYMHVTPRELQVGNFVKQGKTSKEIADILNTTERTVVAHRANLRKKLGLEKKSNLRTYLLSLQ